MTEVSATEFFTELKVFVVTTKEREDSDIVFTIVEAIKQFDEDSQTVISPIPNPPINWT